MEEQPFNDRPDNLHPEKLSKLGLLVAGIAHNLYGPLTGILGMMDLLKLKYPDYANDFERVTGLGHRLRDEIKVMLFKAEIEHRGAIHEVNLNNVVANEIEFYKGDPRFKHMIDVQFDEAPSIDTFPVPAGTFSQSLSNLLANAIESLEDSEKKEIVVRLFENEGVIHLMVLDTGCGMDEETLERAFEPFFTTKTPNDGGKYPATLALGLGLSHAKAMLEDAGALISLHSKLGEGTTAEILIPVEEMKSRFGGETEALC